MCAKGLGLSALQKFKRPAFYSCAAPSVSTQGEYFDGETLVHGIANVVGAQANTFPAAWREMIRDLRVLMFLDGRAIK